jgi:hypothetical protein
MKSARFISPRMINGPTPLIMSIGRSGHVVTGYYPRTSDGKRKPSTQSPPPPPAALPHS